MQSDDDIDGHRHQDGGSQEVAPILKESEAGPPKPDGNGHKQPTDGARSITDSFRLLSNLRWWLKASNVAIAVATVATAVITYWQFQALQDANAAAHKAAEAALESNHIARAVMAKAEADAKTQGAKDEQRLRLTQDSAKAATNSATAAARSADAAARQTELTGQQIHKGQRAYVLPREARLDELPGASNKVRPFIEFKNVGETPALQVRISTFALVLRDESLLTIQPPNPQDGVFDIGAGETSKAESPPEDHLPLVTLSAADVRDITRRTRKLFIGGMIQYRDVFGRDHTTEFCYEHIPGLTTLYLCATRNVVR